MPHKDPAARREYNREYQKQWRARDPSKHRAAKKRYRQRLLRWLHDYKAEHGCAHCPENDPVCLCFHHRDPEAKEFTFGEGGAIWGMARIKKEVAKCDVLCLNCHAKVHGAG